MRDSLHPSGERSSASALEHLHHPDTDDTATHMLHEMCRRFGATPDGLRKAVYAHAAASEPRVSRELVEQFEEVMKSAQVDFFERYFARQIAPRSILVAPSAAYIDHSIQGEALARLISYVGSNDRGERLRALIERGPSGSPEQIGWEPPRDLTELVATIIRWGILAKSDKVRLRVAPEIREEIRTALGDGGYDTNPRLGGMPAVCSLGAEALGHKATMLALGAFPPNVVDLLPSTLSVVTGSGVLQAVTDARGDAGTVDHFCLSAAPSERVFPADWRTVRVHDKDYRCDQGLRLEVIISGTKPVPGFGNLSEEFLTSLGAKHDVVLFGGLHLLETPTELDHLVDRLEALRRGGAPLALVYSQPKSPELEPSALSAIREGRLIDLVSLNTAEAYGLLRRIHADARRGVNTLKLSQATVDRIEQALPLAEVTGDIQPVGREHGAWIARSAEVLQEILAIPIVRVRGMFADVTCIDSATPLTGPDFDALRRSLIMSRVAGSVKAALPHGLISSYADLVPITLPPEPEALVAYWQIIDGMMLETARRNLAYDILIRGVIRTASDRVLIVAPPTPLPSRRGGTTSTGDTIDLLFALEQSDRIRPRAPHPHG